MGLREGRFLKGIKVLSLHLIFTRRNRGIINQATGIRSLLPLEQKKSREMKGSLGVRDGGKLGTHPSP